MSRKMVISAPIMAALCKLQDGLNAIIDPSWRTKRSVDDYVLAVMMESAELIDSYPWKWWKNIKAQPDMKNVTIELVDILHFSLSGSMLLQAHEREDAVAGSGDDASSLRVCGLPVVPQGNANYTASAGGVLFFPLTDTHNAVASFRNITVMAHLRRFDAITRSVIEAADHLHFNLVAYYVAKHTLNCIRQMRGYKDGTYVKVNHGVEDNVLLHECVAGVTTQDATDETLYLQAWTKVSSHVYDAFHIPAQERTPLSHWLDAIDEPCAKRSKVEA